MKQTLLAVALLAIYGTANAAGAFNNCNGNGSCPQNTATTSVATATGTGGAGGAGGSASAGNASAGAFSTVKNFSPEAKAEANSLNVNTNKQGQLQGQQQGQQQGQIQGQSVDNANNAKQKTEVTVEGDTYEARRIPVATAYAPAIAPTAPCMGSSSAGGQGVGFGLSFGTSWTSEECLILETARSFDNLNDPLAALEVRCQAKYAKITTACQKLAEKVKPAKAAVVEPTKVEAPVKSKAAVESYTPVKAVPPVVSSNGYYSVNTNPLTK